MSLERLAAQVTYTFTEAVRAVESRTVQKVKEGISRDVVTELDTALHELSARFIAHAFPDAHLLSEENIAPDFDVAKLRSGRWFVIDPLDGSTNFALSLPGYGYMAAVLDDGVPNGSVIVLPEHDQYLIAAEDGLRTAQRMPAATPAPSASIYYAYPPRLTANGRAARAELLELIDCSSSGLYRSGSACIGLFNLLRGKHSAFIGHGVRLWDALAYVPVLHDRGIRFRYSIDGLRFTLVAAYEEDVVTGVSEIIERHHGLKMHAHEPGAPLDFAA